LLKGLKRKELISNSIVNVCRIVLAVTLVFSGFVKAVDPMGTAYKLADYLTAMGLSGLLHESVLVAVSVALSAAEFCVGIFLLFAIQRRLA
jgi:triosephosphate isomerase